MTLRHFIPFRKTDIVAMCLQHSDFDERQKAEFLHFCKLLQSIYHFEFHARLERLKDQYASVNPDADTRRPLATSENASCSGNFAVQLEQLLRQANYVKLGKADQLQAMAEHSLFKIRLQVDFSDFEEVLVFSRGESQREETVRGPLGIDKKRIRFTNYDRVALYIKFKPDFVPNPALLPDCQPGATLLKLFQNVPKADLEMLFPNTQVRMRTIDRLLIGVPAVVSGTAVITTKLGTTLVLIGSLIGFALGLHNDAVALDKTSALALLAGLGALGGYLWKQFHNYRNRKIKFLKILTENLYFKNLDNNAGVFHRLLDDAEEEECKEAILAYYAVLHAEHSPGSRTLDRWLEHWFSSQWQCPLDFDVEDALDKLARLGLLSGDSTGWQVQPPAAASAVLDKHWDTFFTDNNPDQQAP